LNHPIFRLAKVVKAALRKQVQRQRQAGQPVTENAIVNIAASGVVAGQGGRPLPGLTPATRILVVAIAERLVLRKPETLDEK